MKKVSPSNKIKNPFGSFFKNIFLGIAVFVLSLTMVSFINDNLNITKVSAQYNNVNKDNAGNVGMAIGDGESPLVSGDDGSLIWNIKDVAMSYYDFIYPVIGIDTQSFYDAGLLDDNTGATYFIDEEAFAGLAGGGALYDQTAQNDINSFGNSTAFYDGVYTYSNSLELMSFYNYTSQDTDINALYVNWGHKLYNPVMAYVNSQGEASGLGQSVYGYSLFPSYGFSYSSSNGGMLEPIDGTRLDMTLRNPFTAADAANALLDSDEQTSYYDYTSNNIGGGYVHRAFQNFAGVDENHTYDYILDLSADWAGNVASEFYRNYTYWDNDFDFIRTFFAGRSNHNIDAQEKIGIDFNMLGLYEQSSYNSFVKGDDDETDMGLGCVRGHVLGFLNAQTGSMWVVTLGAKGNDSSEVVPGTEANNRILNNYINFTDPDGFNYCRIRIGNYTRNYPVDEPDQIVRALNLSGVLSEKDIIVDDSVVMVIAPLVNANSLYISDEGSQASVSQSRMSYFVFGKSLTSDAIFEPQVLGGYESGPNNATNIVTSVQGLIDLEYSGLSCVSGTDNSSIKWTPLNWIYLIKDIVTTDDPARNGTSVFTVGFSTNEVEIATSAGLPPLPFDCPPIFLCGYCVATVGGSLIPQFVNNDQGEYVSDLLNEWIVSVTLPPACSVITFHLGVGTINIGSVKYSTYTIPVLENESITLNYSDYDDCSCSYSYDNTTTNLTFMGWGINTPTPTDSSDIWSSGTYLVTGNMGLELYAIWHTSSSISGNGITGYKTSAAGTITVETYAYTGTAGTTYTSTATFYEATLGKITRSGYFSYDFGYSSSSLSSWNRAFVSGSQYYKCVRTGYGFNSGTGTSTDLELSSMTARWYLSNCPSLSGYNLLGFYESTTINDSTLFNRTSRSLTYSASSNSFKHVIIYSKTITAHFSEVDIDGNNSTTLNGTAKILTTSKDANNVDITNSESVGTGLTKTLYTQLYYKNSLVQKYTIDDETVTNIAYVVKNNTTNYKGIYYGTTNDAVTCYNSGNGSMLSGTDATSGNLSSIWTACNDGGTYYFFFVHSADAQQTEYTINFYATSTTSVYNTASVVEGLTYSMPTTPTLDGYTFVGWSEANDYTAEWTSGTQTCSAAKNWYVVWSKTTDGDVTDGSEITVTMKATSSVTYTASQKKQQQTTGIVTNYNCNL
ncbi:MAG: InlB B-repeat-containing protein, partial [Christensenellales bacterium]